MEEKNGLRAATAQLIYLARELRQLTDGRPNRWVVLFFEPSAGVNISYRLDRCGYLLCGRAWNILRLCLLPVFWFCQLLGCRHEICYKADIGSGLRIQHPTLGVVVHGEAIIGCHCLLLGGNSIGERRPIKRGELILGDHVQVSINACVLGPVKVGNNVIIGAGAVVIENLPDGVRAAGVPAKIIAAL